MSNLFCTACGHLLKETSQFCPECGSVRELRQSEVPTQESKHLEPKFEAGLDTKGNGQSPVFLERVKAKPRDLIIAVSLVLVGLFFAGFRMISGSESSVATTPQIESDVSPSITTVPTPVYRALQLGQVAAACVGNELWWNDSSLSFEINGDSSSATVADAWRYRGRENLIVQCGVDTQVSVAIVLKLEPDRLRLIASEIAAGTLVERPSDTVARVGVSRACCYPDVPLETAAVFRFQFRGEIEIDTRAIVRFNEWDVANWRCKSMNEPVWDDGEDLDGFGFSDPESGFLTVCSESSEIFDLQEIFVDKGYELDVDGQFGPDTLDALLSIASQDDEVGVEGVVLVDGDFNYARRRS